MNLKICAAIPMLALAILPFAPKASAQVKDGCTLVTAADVEAVLGEPVRAPQRESHNSYPRVRTNSPGLRFSSPVLRTMFRKSIWDHFSVRASLSLSAPFRTSCNAKLISDSMFHIRGPDFRTSANPNKYHFRRHDKAGNDREW
jgi:hypothetical protein